METRPKTTEVPRMQLEIDQLFESGKADRAAELQAELDRERAQILGAKPVRELVVGLDGIVTTKEDYETIVEEGQDLPNRGKW